jgi:outer membrane receptor for ferrienterochelin and colicin
LRQKDSSIAKIAIGDKEGNFLFENVKDGAYLVSVASVGHQKAFSHSFLVSAAQASIELGVLSLIPLDKNLKEVTVISKKPFIERKIDKTVINVDAIMSNEGTTALEVLEKSPGITVDKDGNVSLKGKQGVMIMLDGKPSLPHRPELTTLLRSMPSNNIDQIEIMTNPSAKYDAAGNSGIINIKTKKNKQKGFNGNVNLAYGQGVYPKNQQ